MTEAIQQGAHRITDELATGKFTDKMLAESDLASESLIVLRRGKKKYALLRFE